MRVITGTAKGCRLLTLDGMDVRPTTDRIKEAMFNCIQFDVPYANVLDLFAGSGQLGIEALSRGAEFCTFVDESKTSISIIEKNLKNTHLSNKGRIVCQNAKDFLETVDAFFDIVFLDPPYHQNNIPNILPFVLSKTKENGYILCEHAVKDKLDQNLTQLTCIRTRRYGKICVTIFRKNEVMS